MAVKHGLCGAHYKERNRAREQTRDNKWLHLYHDTRWSDPVYGLRAQQLKKEPLCRDCLRDGRLSDATIADHIVPHRGNEELFYDPDNLQSLCKLHHDMKTGRGE
jgi:5-methylcytosine-specific restriction protein A